MFKLQPNPTFSTEVKISTPQGVVPLKLGSDVYLSTLRGDAVAEVAGAPLVFVGYGVTAP